MFLNEYSKWLASDALTKDEKGELELIKDDEKEIESRFSSLISFGTAGIRSVYQMGTARFNRFTLSGIGTKINHHFVAEAQNGSHAAHTNRHRRLHSARTETHKTHSIFDREDACGRQSRVFAETVTGHHFGCRTTRFLPCRKNSVTRCQQSGLRVDCQIQFRIGTVGNQFTELFTERAICCLHHSRCRIRLFSPIGHADLLRSLSGEYKR